MISLQDDRTALMLAAERGHVEVVNALRRTVGVNRNQQDAVSCPHMPPALIFIYVQCKNKIGWTYGPHAGSSEWSPGGGECAAAISWFKCEPAGHGGLLFIYVNVHHNLIM